VKKFWIYFSSTVLAVALSYLGNNLPVIPDSNRRWVMPGVLIFTTVSAWLMTKQGEHVPQTGMKGIKIKGNNNKMRAGKHPMEDMHVIGDDNDLNSNDDRLSGGQKP
jgi:hypothetical protein